MNFLKDLAIMPLVGIVFILEKVSKVCTGLAILISTGKWRWV